MGGLMLRLIHTEQKRKRKQKNSLMSAAYSLIFIDSSWSFCLVRIGRYIWTLTETETSHVNKSYALQRGVNKNDPGQIQSSM